MIITLFCLSFYQGGNYHFTYITTMKKLLLLFLFLPTFFYGQEAYLSMDPRIIPFIEDFIEDGRIRGYSLRGYLINKADIIMFDSSLGLDGDSRLGITSPANKMILLSEILLQEKMLLKIVLYHELGHLLKNTGYHSCEQCYDIMSEYAPKTILPYYSEEFLRKKVDEYFDWLNLKD